MTNRIDTMFESCRSNGKKALIAYVTAGYPTLAHSETLIRRLVDEAGVDLVEIGVPFSDPMADGPMIQFAGEEALKAGTKFSQVLAMAENLRKDLDTPMILFSYANILYRYGISELAQKCADIGLDGCLSVDIPFEEQSLIKPELEQRGLYSIPLLSPATPPDRAAQILENAGGFVYCITVKGVTGARTELPDDLAENLSMIRERSPIPVAAGFGISSPEMAAEVSKHADAIVVGSALLKRIQDASSPEQGVDDAVAFVKSLRDAL